MKLQKTIGLVALIWFSFLSVAVAQTSKSDKDYSLAIGVAAFQQDAMYSGGSANQNSALMVEWEWNNWFISNFSVGSYLAASDNWYLAAAVEGDSFLDVDRGDSKLLADMQELDNAYMFSLITGYEGELGSFRFSLNQDISNTHDGKKVKARYSHPFLISGWSLEPSLSIEYVSSSVVDYWVGVSTKEARVGREQYKPGSSFHYSMGLSLSRIFMHKHLIFLDVTQQAFSKQVADSPVINNDKAVFLSAGYLYVF
jgi:outer membrane protein